MKRHFILSLIILTHFVSYSQELKVTLSEDKNKVNRDVGNGVSTIVFESTIKNLIISDDFNDERLEVADNLTFFLINPESETYVNELGYPKRTFMLKTPATSEYILETGQIFPNTVLYYTVTLPHQFPFTISAEYLFTKSSSYGLRLSCGKQFGGYLSYKWGTYNPSGHNISDVTTDTDLTHAKYLGKIRTSITGGARFGVLTKNIKNFQNALYILIGGGYGTYGRQWENDTQVDGNVYFYTDYMKGFNGELSLQLMMCDWIAFSVGADMLISKGKVSLDYMIGVGLNLNFNKLKKKKHDYF